MHLHRYREFVVKFTRLLVKFTKFLVKFTKFGHMFDTQRINAGRVRKVGGSNPPCRITFVSGCCVKKSGQFLLSL